MPKETLDFLSLCAGLDITYKTAGQRGASVDQAVSRFFNKAESILTPLKARRAKPMKIS